MKNKLIGVLLFVAGLITTYSLFNLEPTCAQRTRGLFSTLLIFGAGLTSIYVSVHFFRKTDKIWTRFVKSILFSYLSCLGLLLGAAFITGDIFRIYEGIEPLAEVVKGGLSAWFFVLVELAVWCSVPIMFFVVCIFPLTLSSWLAVELLLKNDTATQNT